MQNVKLWKIALLAFLSMCFQDILGTAMVVFEATYNPALAGAFDVVGWFFGLICSALAIESIIKNGWRTKRSLTIIAAVTAANFIGTYIGVYIAAVWNHH